MNNNPNIIAIVGKGGVGKTALSASLGRILIMKKQKPLLIDADPAQGLTYLLGLGPDYKTIGLVRDEIIERARARGKDAKEEIAAMFDYLVTEALIEKGEFNFLAMGRSQAKGCFCPLNNLLRQAIESLSRNFPYVLIDAEAGIEQINREVVRSVSHLIILIDLSLRSIAVAEKIQETLKRLWIDCRLGVVANRSSGDSRQVQASLEARGIELWGIIPEDPVLRENDLKGKTIFDLPENSGMLMAARKIAEKISK